MSKMINLVGRTFGKLTVIERAANDKDSRTMWVCECECGNTAIIRGKDLRNGKTKSCGCNKRIATIEYNKRNKRKYNTYDLSGDYGVGFTTNTNKPFFFDLSDYDLLKERCWREDAHGYISTTIDKKTIQMTWVIMGDKYYDHINGIRSDNRRCNLRKFECIAQNNMNKGLRKNNTTGCSGLVKIGGKWQARIGVNGRSVSLGVYTDISDAIKARKEAEEKYFGEWARKDV